MTTSLVHFSHDGIFCPACWRWGMGMFAHPLALYIYPFNWSSVSPSTSFPGKTNEIYRYLYSTNRPSLFLSACHNPKSTGDGDDHFFSPSPKANCCNLQRDFLPTFISLWFRNPGWVLHPLFLLLSGCEGGGRTKRIDWWQWQGTSEWVSRASQRRGHKVSNKQSSKQMWP
jgi:hypothetical protein